jgi:hypothetical protein
MASRRHWHSTRLATLNRSDKPGAFVGISAPAQITQLQQEREGPRWSLATRVDFRFCVVYFALFCLSTQIVRNLIPIPKVHIPDLQTLRPIRPIILWVATYILRITHPVAYADTGSGDRTFDWITVFVLLVVAALATVIWSFLDRRRPDYVSLYKWFRLFVRFWLASQMITYGMVKIIPLQMPYPYLTTLLEPFGNFSPMGVLWSSIGSSPAYETFAGCAEMLGGLLLIVPRTTMIVEGNMDGHAIHTELQLLDRNKSLLVNRGFHWIQESPYNR